MSILRTAIISLLYIVLLGSPLSVMIRSAHPSPEYKPALNISMDTSLSTNLTVYLLNLPGIPSSMGNASRFLEGIRDATRNGTFDASTAYGSFLGSNTQVKTSVSFHFAQVNDWTFYRQIILTASSFVLINSHGSYLPIPKGYSPSQWFDQILNAMSNRYGTWVHISGYPFYNAWFEGGGLLQGPGLFLKLSSYAGWAATILSGPSGISAGSTYYLRNIDRWPNPVSNDPWNFVNSGTAVSRTSYTNFTLAALNPGPGFHGFYQESDGNTVYYSGVAARVNGTTPGRFGLYVHFVPGVFGSDYVRDTGIDHDYGTGLVSVLIALEWHIEETVGAIQLAERNIAQAEYNGATQGLDLSRNLLSSARSLFGLGQDLEAWSSAYLAAVSASDAQIPWWTALWTQAWPYLVLIGGIVAFSLFAAVGAIVPSAFGAAAGRFGNGATLIERVSGFLRKRLSRQRRGQPENVD